MKRFLYTTGCLLTLLLSITDIYAQPFKRKWIDSIYNSMTEEERIGQLFMVAAYSGGKNYNQPQIEKLITAGQIGGIIFMQGTPEEQAKQTNRYQKMAGLQLLIGMDAEWGLGMRLTGVKNFPRQMMIGATRDTLLMYEMAEAVANQCKRMGVHIDFAPDIDINNNAKNPVINFRSFGEDKEWVSRLGIAYMRGLQDNGIMACAKHFPGHGDVAVDSHHDLPVINKTRAQLNDMEFYPFRKLIEAGVQSAMIAHLSVPALDNTKNRPTTLSKSVVTDLLKKEMGFKGLVFTDALNMKGLTKYFPDGETDLQAFLAGNDVLLFSQNVPLAIGKIKWAIQTGKVTAEDLEQRVKKILSAKYDMGLWRYRSVKPEHATADLNKAIDDIREKISRAAITLVKDQAQLLNKIKAGKGKFAYLNINGSNTAHLPTELKKKFPDMVLLNFPVKSNAAAVKTMMGKLSGFDVVIAGIHDLAMYPGSNNGYGLDTSQLSLLQQLSAKGNTLFTVMGNAYLLKHFCQARSIIVAYEDDLYTEEAAFEVMTGKLKAKGILPVRACK